MSINKVMLLGRTVRPIELKSTSNGITVANFTLAVENRMKGSNGEKISSFFNCVAWSGVAEVAGKYVKKGDRVAVVGELCERKYTSKEGTTRSIFEINISQLELIEPKTQAKETTTDEFLGDDDLPF